MKIAAGSATDGLEAKLEEAVRAYVFQPLPGAKRTATYNEERTSRRLAEEDDTGVDRFAARIAAEVAPGSTIVELGSGTGGFSVNLARRGYRVIGVEPHEDGVRAGILRAQRYPQISCRFVEGVAEALPLDSNSVEAIVSNQVVEHLAQLDGGLAEMIRVLRPGGLALHSMPNYAFPYEPHYRVPFPPRINRKWARRYLRLLRRETTLFDTSIFPTTNQSILPAFVRHGFVGVHNRYAYEVARKLEGGSIGSRRIAAIVGAAERVGLLPAVRTLVLRWEIYPAIVVMAWKPPLPADARVLVT